MVSFPSLRLHQDLEDSGSSSIIESNLSVAGICILEHDYDEILEMNCEALGRALCLGYLDILVLKIGHYTVSHFR
jgi:hypothetical protein